MRQTLVCPLWGASRAAALAPHYTVVEIATGVEHRAFESLAEVVASLAFARLAPDDVEIVCDASPMAAYAAM